MTWKLIICLKRGRLGPEMSDECATNVSGGGKSILMMLRVFCMSAFSASCNLQQDDITGCLRCNFRVAKHKLRIKKA